jgi:hypothetical protein
MVKLYVEGGGDSQLLKTACRQGFSEFLGKAGLAGRMPRVVAGGSRNSAYDMFCTSIKAGEPALLLVDSEELVKPDAQQGNGTVVADRAKWKPWLHLKQRVGDAWVMPAGSEDAHCHLMAQCMESWLLADRDALSRFFGQGFKESALPAVSRPMEELNKPLIYQALAQSTSDCKTKAAYGKGDHSFKLLALIDPAKVFIASPWAQRFIETLRFRMGQV